MRPRPVRVSAPRSGFAGFRFPCKVAGRWVYLYRAIDQDGQVIDVLVSPKRDLAATRRFFTRALVHGHARPR
jgi:transposase-like protein